MAFWIGRAPFFERISCGKKLNESNLSEQKCKIMNKEKFIYGDVLDGPSPKSRLSQFDKLSLEMKDKIRCKVIACFRDNKLCFK